MVPFEPLDPCDKPSKVRFNSELHVNATTEAVRKEELNTGAISRLGFPNINQSCYMNSILQSLFAMVDLIKDFTCQKPVWGSVPEAKLIRSFMAIRDAHLSSGTWNKRRLLRSFRKAASTQGLSFSDQNQEDAHEFLISVLDQMRSLSSLLEVNAASMKRRYTCPVQRHLMFQIEKTRTCKRCGAQSKRKEDFTNLSLDLIPSGSVKEMVQAYVNVRSACPHSITSLTEHTPRQFVFVWTCFYNMWPVDSHLQETELEFKCECGGNTSGQRMAFETLPNVLILHLKRFIYSPTYELVKLHDPVKLSRDLVVSSNTGDGCYGLISVVGHFGSNGQAGHYICDSVHPDDSLSQTTDHWLTFDDSVVSNTTGASVCEQRRKSSYILFYKKQDAHEFLTSVLDQMRSLSSLLEVNAASMKRRYICPVQRHLICGAQSKRKEDFTNLSLDLIPSGSVKEMVQAYVNGDGCYGLISIVSHFGSNGQGGHYICDSVHPDGSLSQTTDHWLTFDDSVVSNTTGASVCEQRRKSSYILFYKRQNGKRARQMFCATDDGLQDKSMSSGPRLDLILTLNCYQTVELILCCTSTGVKNCTEKAKNKQQQT
ncbi:Ubiquitin carboxyl-terminal hydrolase 37 [Nibea albiflora]|uniref:Ubiquitin carboxyl-terminal hydrolase 37 n=1 Tax=Nibea albiflora TaxID=240163 RepID=A0ACB7F9F5_NIBAL|nr:Ubiquitin carboxyl-terminal hydrolase 37 [Nibea albiflora]